MNNKAFARRIKKFEKEARKILRVVHRKVIPIKIESISRAGVAGFYSPYNNCIIISPFISEYSDKELRYVVWHEMGHAYFDSVEHKKGCPLMGEAPPRKIPAKSELERALKRSVAAWKKRYREIEDCM